MSGRAACSRRSQALKQASAPNSPRSANIFPTLRSPVTSRSSRRSISPTPMTGHVLAAATGVTSGSGNSWAKDCRGALGRFRLWRELGGKVREIGGAIRGDKEVLGRFRAELEDRLRWQRVSLGKRAFRSGAGDREQGGRILPRGPGRVGETGAGGGRGRNGISVRYGWRRDEFYTLKYSMLEERLEQVREIDGELAYEKMRRAVEKASQEKARQEEWARQERTRQSRERRGPERGGPERDFGPSR